MKPLILSIALALSAFQVFAKEAPAVEWTDAEVRKVDKEASKLTLKHAPIKSLDMPAMTMVFQAKSGLALEAYKAGDKVQVRVISEGNKYLVTEIKAAP